MDPRGRVYRDPAGKGWRGRVTINGKRRYVRGRTQKEARAKLDALIDERDEDDESPLTLSAWLDEWLVWCVRRENPVRPRTVAAYGDAVRLRIKPFVGDKLLTEMTPALVRAWHQDVAARGGKNGRPVGASTVHQAHRTLSSALARAVVEGHLTRNVAALTGGPSRASVKPPPALTHEQAAAMVAEVRRNPDNVQMGIARLSCGLVLGLRQSEALGLWVSDVDLDNSFLRVHAQRTREKWRHGDRCTNLSGHTAACCPERVRQGESQVTKSAAGARLVPMPDEVVDVMRNHLSHLAALRLRAGSQWRLHQPDWLFPGPLGAPPDHRADARRWVQLVERAAEGAPTGTHAARRRAATAWAETGADRALITAAFGWTRPELVDLYARPGVERSVAVANEVWSRGLLEGRDEESG